MNTSRTLLVVEVLLLRSHRHVFLPPPSTLAYCRRANPYMCPYVRSSVRTNIVSAAREPHHNQRNRQCKVASCEYDDRWTDITATPEHCRSIRLYWLALSIDMGLEMTEEIMERIRFRWADSCEEYRLINQYRSTLSTSSLRHMWRASIGQSVPIHLISF